MTCDAAKVSPWRTHKRLRGMLILAEHTMGRVQVKLMLDFHFLGWEIMENNYIQLVNTDTNNEQSHKQLDLALDLTSPDRSEIDVSRCQTVYEDGHYELTLYVKLSEIEAALKTANEKQKQATETDNALQDGADLARQDFEGSKADNLDKEEGDATWDSLFARETESLHLNPYIAKQYRAAPYQRVVVQTSNFRLRNAAYKNAKNGTFKSTYPQQGNVSRPYIRGVNGAPTQYGNASGAFDAEPMDEDDEINLRLYNDCFKKLNSVQIFLNNQPCGYCEMYGAGSGYYKGMAKFEHNEGNDTKQPFLLQYDVQLLSFCLKFEGGTTVTLYAPPLLCASLNSKDTENINQILFELTNLENNKLLDLMFKKGQQTASKSNKDDWMNFDENRSYQSLSEYITSIEQIIKCYTNNFSYFKTQGKHILKKALSVVPFNQVKQFTGRDFNWLTKHLEELNQVDASNAVINYKGTNYQPLHMQTETMRKSYATYENEVVIGFLHMVLHNANKIANEYQAFIAQKREQLNQGTQLSHGAYQAPIITMQLIQLDRCEQELQSLYSYLNQLSNLYLNYQQIFNLPPTFLRTFPRKSKIFQELKPYAEIFLMIWRFFHFGNFHLDKDRMLFEVTTLDRLFEYYCLYRLLEMLDQKGFKAIPYGNRIFEYSMTHSNAGLKHADDDSVANTYVLRRGDQQAVLYYQPVIYSRCFENGIRAFRTTEKKYLADKNHGDFYTPDFILKFRKSSEDRFQEDYIIFDAKFAQTNSILQNYISELTRKYGFEIAIAQIKPHLKSLHSDKVERGQSLDELLGGLGQDSRHSIEQDHTVDQRPSELVCRDNKHEYDFAGSKPPRMLFALQGRLNLKNEGQQSFNSATGQRNQNNAKNQQRSPGVYMKNLRNMMLVHNSPLADLCTPPTAIGLVEFNTQNKNSTPALWHEIERNIPYLADDPRSQQEIEADGDQLGEDMDEIMADERAI